MTASLSASLICISSLVRAGAPAAASDAPAASAAPASSENVAIHVIEPKQFADGGRHEFALYPIAAQVNGKFTEHLGTAIGYTYHLNENFGFQLVPQYNWHAASSGFSQELVDKVSQEPVAATSLLLQWALQAGVEVAPLYGKFALGQSTLVHFSFIVSGGAGIVSTSHQLKPGNAGGPATFGDTGIRPAGSLGGGFRVQLGNRFAIRLELRDLVYSARVTRVNGCSASDLAAMSAQLDQGQSVTSATVSSGCDVRRFDGVDPRTHYNRNSDVPLALSLVSAPSSDVINNLGFYAGLSFVY
jgi:outer membrane beta-barrel protein